MINCDTHDFFLRSVKCYSEIILLKLNHLLWIDGILLLYNRRTLFTDVICEVLIHLT